MTRAMFEVENNCDTFTATINEDGRLYIEIDEPWSGSTETGFGQTSYFYLSKEDAAKFAFFILANHKDSAP